MEQELWELPFVLVLMRVAGFCLGVAEEVRFEMGRPPFSQITQHPHKNLFTLLPASASRVCLLWWQAAELAFLFSNKLF